MKQFTFAGIFVIPIILIVALGIDVVRRRRIRTTRAPQQRPQEPASSAAPLLSAKGL